MTPSFLPLCAGVFLGLTAVAAADGAETVGVLTIDGNAHDLTVSYWCEPEPSLEQGQTLTLRVLARNESGDVNLLGTEIERDRDRPTLQRLSATTNGSSVYRSGDVTPRTHPEPAMVVENGNVTMKAEVMGAGEIVDLEAEFTLPEEPGAPGYC